MKITGNTIKNLLVVVIALLLYPVLNEALQSVEATSMNDFLLIISIFLVTVCFANFAFTYEKAKMGRLRVNYSPTGLRSFSCY